MRQELIDLLDKFLKEECTISGLHTAILGLLKAGLRKQLRQNESRPFQEFFDWYLDKYDPTLPPRPGVFGRLRDVWDQVLHGEYRVSDGEIRTKAQELAELLRKGDEQWRGRDLES